MDKNYELFIEQLTNGIHNFADIPLENIEFTNTLHSQSMTTLTKFAVCT